MVRIWIQPRGLSLTAEPGERLLDLVDEQSVASVPLSCRGARCGICRLRVVRGGGYFEPAGSAERETLAELGAAADERLACQLWLAHEAGSVDARGSAREPQVDGHGSAREPQEAELELLSAPPADG